MQKESNIEIPSPERIGLDEAGKGDYFGPLAVAAAYLDSRTEAEAKAWGVRDSKTLSDARVLSLASQIQQRIPHYILRLDPLDYNRMYDGMQNLNILLATCHAQALESLLTIQPCGLAIADQFAHDPAVLSSKLMDKGKKVQLIQTPRGERDLAVAAASILARASFLQGMQGLRQKYNIPFPKGSTNVVPVLDQFVAQFGRYRLQEVAKVHFKLKQLRKNIEFFE